MSEVDTSPEALRALAAEADYAMDLNALVKWAVKVRKLLRTLAAIAAEKEAAGDKPDLTTRPLARLDALALWKKHGGDTFGPRVEHVSMPLAKFAGFIDALLAPLRASLAGAEQERDAAIARAEEAERDRDSADAGAEALEAKIATLCKYGRTCGCSYDHKDHVCMYHSPQLTAAVERAEKAEARVERMRAALQEAEDVFELVEEPASEDPHYGAAVEIGREGRGVRRRAMSQHGPGDAPPHPRRPR